MFAVRSAMLLLALSLLLSPSVVSASSVESSGADGRSVSCAGDSPIGELDVVSLNDAAGVSRTVFRKLRQRAVLEETDHELEEADLGPIPVPRKLNSHTSIAVSSPFFPRTCRLRC
jgi:hypothetical protein